ncbi:cysteine hydrolase family protein [Amycolatopsis magusensis]|uniref:cysteine hydrolase family protein n=1 Tax=Amycolatopsis magusensis TaxID=882444 RepID=UPI0024A9E49E|nr:isochorismatase family cysteine hydrolase [Amycolatopsis magusensis]MDI5978605.1 isochorismatase family cysteine hydrolase [Amycolatopsis magusensis]
MSDTALLMIDMQNGYLADDGTRDALGWPPIWRLSETIAACGKLLDEARKQHLPVIYSRSVGSAAGSLGENPRYARFMELRASRLPSISVDQQAWKGQIMEAVAPQPADVVLDKTRASFFEYTELEPILRNLEVSRLIVAGLQTNVCVEATARAALSRNFEVAVADDAVSTDGPALHHAALNSMRVLYVEIAPWSELLAPGAAWDRAFTTPDYGRDPEYWSEITAARRT